MKIKKIEVPFKDGGPFEVTFDGGEHIVFFCGWEGDLYLSKDEALSLAEALIEAAKASKYEGH